MKIGDLGPSLRKRLQEAGHLRRGLQKPGAEVKAIPARKNKYGARSVSLDGHVFQSQLEADFYRWAKLIHGAALKVHPTVTLVGGIKFKCDFAFPEKGRLVFVDTKSDATAGGRFPTIKRLWAVSGPGVLRIVYRGPRGTFITKQEIHPKKKNPESRS